MLPDGSMTMTGAYNGNEHPNSKDLYDLMVKAFKEEARTGKYKATGIVYDGMAVPPGATEKTDVIAIRRWPYPRWRGSPRSKGSDAQARLGHRTQRRDEAACPAGYTPRAVRMSVP